MHKELEVKKMPKGYAVYHQKELLFYAIGDLNACNLAYEYVEKTNKKLERRF